MKAPIFDARRRDRMRAGIIFGIILMLFSPGLEAQQTGEEELGNWLMYGGTHRINKPLSIHSEAQFRFYRIRSILNQILLRTGLNYHISPDAMVTAGYAYILTESFVKGSDQVSTHENRIWQQFVLRNSLGRLQFGHRYRLEQRWLLRNGELDYRDRTRYRLSFVLPINNREIEVGTFFLVASNELFIHLDREIFDQNRIYGAVGYKFNDNINVEVGYLRNRQGSLGFNRLQFGLSLTTDARE